MTLFRRIAIEVTSVCLALTSMVAVQGAPLDPNAFTSLGTLDLSSGSLTFNTSTLSVSGAFSGTGVLQPQGAGLPDIAVFTFDELAIENGVTLNLIGFRPIAILSKGNAMIDQFININGGLPSGGGSIGGTARLGGGAGGNGQGATDPQNGSGPGGGGIGTPLPGDTDGYSGGGGGFGGDGGNGGGLRFDFLAPGGMAYGDLATALQGGSGGGGGIRKTQLSPNAGGGGGSGGAIEIGALGTVYVGLISIQGGAGASVPSGGGGGGGSGGAVLLHGQTVTVAGGILADGGDGGASTDNTLSSGGGGSGGGRILVRSEMLSLDIVLSASVSGGQPGANIAPVQPGISGESGIAVLEPVTTIIPAGCLVQVQANGALPSDTAGVPWSLQTDRLRFDAGSIGAALAPVASGHDIDLNGGIVVAALGWTMTGAAQISGFGQLSGAVTGGATNHVAVSGGTLILGDANHNAGFSFAGTVGIASGATLHLLDADAAELGAETTLAGGGRLNSLNGVLLGAGEIVTASAAAEIGGEFTNQGTVNGPAAAGEFLTFSDDVDGPGNYTGNVRFSDGFSPGASPAQVSFEHVAFDATAELSIELGGTTPGSQFDQLTVAGDATLGGQLTVSLIDSFTPSAGQTFTILTAGDVAGAFTNELLPAVPGLFFDVIYNPNSVVLTVSPAFTADFDNDGDVDAADLAQWQGDFGANALSDADDDGDSDGADFLAWQRQLGSGAGVASAEAVPEPSASVLGLLAVSIVVASRGRTSS